MVKDDVLNLGFAVTKTAAFSWATEIILIDKPILLLILFGTKAYVLLKEDKTVLLVF